MIDTAKSQSARLVLAGAISLTAIGVALAGTVSRPAGGVVVLVGWLAVVVALHRFGRTGSAGDDAPKDAPPNGD